MESSSFTQPGLVESSPNRARALDNRACVYCSGALTQANISREHVIGRRFVPKGKLHGNWNLIVNACRACNARKADLEDDISAITLQPDLWGRYGHDDDNAVADARRKAEDARSRRTKKAVKDSREQVRLRGRLGSGINLSFQWTAPPQIEDQRAFELARMQLVAFFYMQTYNRETRRGGYWLHGYHPVMQTTRGDWGNPVMTAFMCTIESWDCRMVAITADGFFRTITRRHPSAETWAWAIEWNHSRRLIGFFGEREPAQQIVNGFPQLRSLTIYQASNESLSYRTETPLSEDDDTLFWVPGATDLPEPIEAATQAIHDS